MDNPKPLLERELSTFCAAKMIKYLRMQHVEIDGRVGYHLYVHVKAMEKSNEEMVLIAHNTKKPRLWVNADRALQHFKETYKYSGRVYFDI